MPFIPAHGASLGGKYRLLHRLAGGGMGTVWLARHDALGVEVAVKLMSAVHADTPMAATRFEREAKASAQLKSPHIVKVHDFGTEDGTPYMVMERLVGEDLGARIAGRGRLSLEETLRYAVDIGKALTAAHEAGIVHRDLKPSNVFLAREGEDEVVKLLDFGVARELNNELVDERTVSGVVVGSPHHMSPEQALGERVDHRSDLWSLGVVVFRALTGQRPFQGENVTAVMLAVVSKPIPRARDLRPDLPEGVDGFFLRALARNAEDRFADATSMVDALSAVLSGVDAGRLCEKPAHARPQRGRDEPTLDGAASPFALSTGPKPAEVVLQGVPGTARRRIPVAARWVALALGVGAVGFFAGRVPPRTQGGATERIASEAPPLAVGSSSAPVARASTTLAPTAAASDAVAERARDEDRDGGPHGEEPAGERTERTPKVDSPKRKTFLREASPRPPPAPRATPAAARTSPRADVDPFTGLPLLP